MIMVHAQLRLTSIKSIMEAQRSKCQTGWDERREDHQEVSVCQRAQQRDGSVQNLIH